VSVSTPLLPTKNRLLHPSPSLPLSISIYLIYLSISIYISTRTVLVPVIGGAPPCLPDLLQQP
jgi:hypothetical protein